MKAKVLIAEQFDGSGWTVVRVYNEPDFEQAQKDCDMLMLHSDKKIKLHDVEVFNPRKTHETP